MSVRPFSIDLRHLEELEMHLLCQNDIVQKLKIPYCKSRGDRERTIAELWVQSFFPKKASADDSRRIANDNVVINNHGPQWKARTRGGCTRSECSQCLPEEARQSYTVWQRNSAPSFFRNWRSPTHTISVRLNRDSDKTEDAPSSPIARCVTPPIRRF